MSFRTLRNGGRGVLVGATLVVMAGAVSSEVVEEGREKSLGHETHASFSGKEGEGDPDIEDLRRRTLEVTDAFTDLQSFYEREVLPIERAIFARRADSTLAKHVALTLYRESKRKSLDPWLMAGVLFVENPWIDPGIDSWVGAMGLMQVMPFHAGNWGCDGNDLHNIEINICHGIEIFAFVLKRAGGDFDKALLAYNGCVNGTNTPNCHLYPSWVRMRKREVEKLAGPAGRSVVERSQAL